MKNPYISLGKLQSHHGNVVPFIFKPLKNWMNKQNPIVIHTVGKSTIVDSWLLGGCNLVKNQ